MYKNYGTIASLGTTNKINQTTTMAEYYVCNHCGIERETSRGELKKCPYCKSELEIVVKERW